MSRDHKKKLKRTRREARFKRQNQAAKAAKKS